MNILIVAATTREIEPFLSYYRENKRAWDVDVLITGVGLLSTSHALTRQLHLKKPDLVIQAGIAGCFEPKIPLGTVVLVKQDAVADLGVMENNELRTLFDLGLVKLNQPPFKKGWLGNPEKELMKKSGLKVVSAISVNQVSTSKTDIQNLQRKFSPVIESMEGAALHYVCLMEKIIQMLFL
ncbi:MAG: futalosine hydrolase, partial [Chitinophagaceae bacterium]|nr:futalosine hydrolase [Chitinophagaceae bacterium]